MKLESVLSPEFIEMLVLESNVPVRHRDEVTQSVMLSLRKTFGSGKNTETLKRLASDPNQRIAYVKTCVSRKYKDILSEGSKVLGRKDGVVPLHEDAEALLDESRSPLDEAMRHEEENQFEQILSAIRSSVKPESPAHDVLALYDSTFVETQAGARLTVAEWVEREAIRRQVSTRTMRRRLEEGRAALVRICRTQLAERFGQDAWNTLRSAILQELAALRPNLTEEGVEARSIDDLCQPLSAYKSYDPEALRRALNTLPTSHAQAVARMLANHRSPNEIVSALADKLYHSRCPGIRTMQAAIEAARTIFVQSLPEIRKALDDLADEEVRE
ncbi:MAG: hypothetical protein AAFX05_10045 [Planctomycetota bacterium]